MKIAALISGLIVATMAVSGCAHFDTGVAAYERGDYEAALRYLKPRATAGDPDAQFYMYQIYYSYRNFDEADRWLQKAAKSNHPKAISKKEDEKFLFSIANTRNDRRLQSEYEAFRLAQDIANYQGDPAGKMAMINNYIEVKGQASKTKKEVSGYYQSLAYKARHPGALSKLAGFALENEEYEKAIYHLLEVANRGSDQLPQDRNEYVYEARRFIGHLFNGKKEITFDDMKLDSKTLEKLRKKLHVSEDKVEAYVWYKLAQRDDATINDEIEALVDVDKKRADERFKNWKEKDRKGVGSGFYVGSNLIMTNWHVVSKESKVCDEIRVPFRQAELLASDEATDLAILRVQGEVNREVAVLRQGDPDITEEVVAFGYPLVESVSVQGNFTSGIVSGIRDPYTVFKLYDDIKERSGMIMHTAPISGGNSGGPLLDKYGRVIGVNTEVEPPNTGPLPQNINYAMGYKKMMDIMFIAAIKLMRTGEYSPEMSGMTEDEIREYLETGGRGSRDSRMAEEDYIENESKSMKELYNLAKAMTVRIECWRNRN